MLRPTYAISLGTATLSSDHLGPLVSLDVERAKNAGAEIIDDPSLELVGHRSGTHPERPGPTKRRRT